MTTRYRVRDWDQHFENSRSRDYKKLDWVPIPNKHDGKGYRRLIALENGPALFAAWVLIVQVASKCPQRGVLADEDGPLDADDLSHKTGCPAEVFAQAFNALCQPKIGWMEAEQLTESVSTLTDAVSTLTDSVSIMPLNRTEENRTEEKRPELFCSPDGGSERCLPAASSKDDSEKADTKAGTSAKFSDEDKTLAYEMFDGIKAIQPNARPPNLDRWANEMRLLHADGQDRTPENIRATLAWVRQDQFWKSNVLSPANLREKWDQLQLKRKSQNESRTTSSKPDGQYRATTKSGGNSF